MFEIDQAILKSSRKSAKFFAGTAVIGFSKTTTKLTKTTKV